MQQHLPARLCNNNDLLFVQNTPKLFDKYYAHVHPLSPCRFVGPQSQCHPAHWSWLLSQKFNEYCGNSGLFYIYKGSEDGWPLITHAPTFFPAHLSLFSHAPNVSAVLYSTYAPPTYIYLTFNRTKQIHLDAWIVWYVSFTNKAA